MREAYAHCEALVRAADKDRFLAALFAPAAARPHLFALYAFASEIARVREIAHEPLPGEIRLQWWRDALKGSGHGDVRGHPVAAALIDAIEACRLPVDPLLDLIEARSFDLYDDPMPTLDALHGYARKTSSALIALAARILAGRSDRTLSQAADHGGAAWAVAVLLRAFPLHATRGQIYVPLDVLGRHGAEVADIRAGRTTPGLRAAHDELRDWARQELAEFRDVAPHLPEAVGPAFLPLALVPGLLARLEKSADNPFVAVEVAPWRRQWTLWRAARRPLARMI